MKLTHPLIVVGGLLALAIAIGMVLHKPKPAPPKMVQVESAGGVRDSVAIVAGDDSEALLASIKEIDAKTDAFKDSATLATSTARIALAPVVADMQKQVRANADLPFPECMQPAKDDWVQFQRTTVDAFIAFMGGSDEAGLIEQVSEAGRLRRNFEMVRDSCKRLGEGRI